MKEEQFRPLDEDLLKYTFYSLQSTFVVVAVVQLLSCVPLFVTPWTEELQASLFFNIFWSLLKVMSTESVMPSNHLLICRPLLLLPSIFPSIRVFSNESALRVRGPTYLYPCLSCFPLLVFKNHQGQWFHPGSLGGKTLKVHPSSQTKQWFKSRNYIHFPDEEAKIQRLRHKGK